MKSGYLFYFCDGIGSVFDSQVLALLEAINRRNVFKKIYLFIGIRDENQKKDFLRKYQVHGINVVYFKSYPSYPFFNYLSRRSIKSALFSQGINLKEVLFHTRGEMIAWHVSKIIDHKYHNYLLADIRGVSVEETNEFSGLNKLIRLLKTINNRKALSNLKKFKNISVVSDSLKEYLINNYNINDPNITVTPCLAGERFRYEATQSIKKRNELNVANDDLLIAFSSGGTANWQNNDVLIKLAEKGIKVLNLSKKNIPHKNIINKFVSYAEMPGYLCAPDAAILWRDASIVNKVASPVKFSEYICCGLPVISNRSVDLVREYIINEDCGLIINNLDELGLDQLNQLKQKDRSYISNKAIQKFGVETIIQSYLTTYSSIIKL